MSADAAVSSTRRWMIGVTWAWDDQVVLSWNDAGPTLLCRRRACRRDGLVPWEAELPPNCTPEDAVLFANGHRSTHPA